MKGLAAFCLLVLLVAPAVAGACARRSAAALGARIVPVGRQPVEDVRAEGLALAADEGIAMNEALVWSGDWAWSLPLIVVNVVLHVLGLGFINANVLRVFALVKDGRNFLTIFCVVMGVTVLLATVLHGLEATIWALAYRLLGAVPDDKSAMLYSLEAITSYGHNNLYLAAHWQLMGALEALNGMLLLGLTTAFLYGLIQRVWPVEDRRWHSHRERKP
jgi:hypothetical protein